MSLGKRISVFITLLILVFIYQNCDSGFQVHSDGSISSLASSEGPLEEGETPLPSEPDEPPVELPTPTAESLYKLLPNLPSSQCQPKKTVADPFAGVSFNKKTVCESGCDFTQIDDAFKAAKAFDEIVVQGGRYNGCLTIRASPVIVRGENGLALIDTWPCDHAITIYSEQIKISNFKITNTKIGEGVGLALRQEPQFVQVSGFWFDGLATALSGGAPTATILIQDFKVKNIGYVWGDNDHRTAVISTSPETLIVKNGTFSHHNLNSWLVGTHGGHFEFLCNVSVRVNNDDGLFFHFQSNKYVRIAGNYFHKTVTDTLPVIYQYNQSAPTDIVVENNVILLDNPKGSILSASPVKPVFHFQKNTVIGGAAITDATENTYHATREAAGYPAAPQFPNTWPVKEY